MKKLCQIQGFILKFEFYILEKHDIYSWIIILICQNGQLFNNCQIFNIIFDDLSYQVIIAVQFGF